MKSSKVKFKISTVIKFVLLVLTLFIWIIGPALLAWYSETFGVSFREIIYTIKSPMKGADTHFLRHAIKYSVLQISVFAVVIIVIIIGHIKFKEKAKIATSILLVISLIGSAFVLKKVDDKLLIFDFVKAHFSQTHIYEEYYVKPDIDSIQAQKPKNLLYIYLESMETMYASADVCGGQPEINYIPKLTKLADENISFSNTDKLGGFHCTTGTSWTVAAIFASQTGLPFCYPIEGNENFGKREAFAKGVISLGDILESNGYYQEFLCGSRAQFGGRKAFFEQHGGFDIFDRKTSVEKGYVTKDEFVFWGVEDKNLYKEAKDELTRMASLDQPFNLTMLTVDTHHVDGWVCDLCGDEYPEQLANVAKCADNQIDDFISWCKEQPWYENTVIVIQGDHPRMDTALFIEGYDRTVYDCFINAEHTENVRLKNRSFTPMDMLPTTLSAMGFTIPGDRLGLGTNMFSDRETLAEELGLDYINTETEKYSSYYINNFS